MMKLDPVTMKKHRPSHFKLQHDQYDCGVTCLRNILNYYKADISLEKLREWSGSGIQGTSLLGLHQAAGQAGFKAEGARGGDVADLRSLQHPCILHVTLEAGIQHYLIYYPTESNLLLIGDPAKGLTWLYPAELEKIWIGHTLLLLEPGEQLSQWQQQRQKKLRWVWQTLKEDVHLLYVALGLGLLCALLNLSTAVFSQRLIDYILPSKDHSALFIGLSLLGLLLIMKSGFSFLRQQLLIRQGYGFNLRITGGFFRSILSLNKSFFDHRKTGDLIARLNDTQRIQQAASYILGEMTIQCLLLLVTLCLLFIYSWPIAVFCLVMIPIIAGIVKLFEGGIIRGQRSVMVAHAQNESNYVDSIRGIHTIKAMNRESLFAGIAANFFLSLQTSVMQLGKIRIRFNVLLEIITALFLLTVIGWAALDTWNGSLRTGQMIAILQLAGILMQTVILVALTNLQVQEAAVALDRMYEFTILDPEYDAANASIGGATHTARQGAPNAAGEGEEPIRFERLSVEKLEFRFPGKKLLLKDISMELRRGEIIALSGESGQGKSTLLQILQKFYPYDGGPVWVNNQEMQTIDTPAWRKMIGVVPQDIVLFSGTLLANICLDPGTENIDQVRQFCHLYGFDRFFESLPQSYTTLLGEGGVALSGGQKQLLALARCLYASPQLILLDEPTAAMDAATEHFVITILQRFRQQAGMLIISHKDSLTEIADRVYLLEKGTTYQVPRSASFSMAN
ncbi:MAG TPA: ABC transporter transmembrane domain-containing protein [Puia sp.]|nr:ABC transporter transmembrane domain-containing protein [Puia sp.]